MGLLWLLLALVASAEASQGVPDLDLDDVLLSDSSSNRPLVKSATRKLLEFEREFVGWLGEKRTVSDSDASQPSLEVLSWKPKIFLAHHILTDGRCSGCW